MRYLVLLAALTLPLSPVWAADGDKPAVEPKPAALIADGVPDVPADLIAKGAGLEAIAAPAASAGIRSTNRC